MANSKTSSGTRTRGPSARPSSAPTRSHLRSFRPRAAGTEPLIPVDTSSWIHMLRPSGDPAVRRRNELRQRPDDRITGVWVFESLTERSPTSMRLDATEQERIRLRCDYGARTPAPWTAPEAPRLPFGNQRVGRNLRDSLGFPPRSGRRDGEGRGRESTGGVSGAISTTESLEITSPRGNPMTVRCAAAAVPGPAACGGVPCNPLSARCRFVHRPVYGARFAPKAPTWAPVSKTP